MPLTIWNCVLSYIISSRIISVKMGLFLEEITFITELLGSNFLPPRFLTDGKWDFQVANLLLATANFEPCDRQTKCALQFKECLVFCLI